MKGFARSLLIGLAISLIWNAALKAEKLAFSLYDCDGNKVTSQDYKGVPLFLEFGACW